MTKYSTEFDVGDIIRYKSSYDYGNLERSPISTGSPISFTTTVGAGLTALANKFQSTAFLYKAELLLW